MEVVYERCCGLDVHKRNVVACLIVPGPDGLPHKQVRIFTTMTEAHLATTYLTHTCRKGSTKTYRLSVDAMSLRTVNSCQYAELWPNAQSRPSRPQCVFVPLS